MIEGIGLICTVVGLGSGALIWVVAAMMAPLKEAIRGDRARLEELIQNNTAAMLDLRTVVKDHADMLQEHHVRLAVIETKHEANHGGGK